MRALIYVPIIHGEADLGQLGRALPQRPDAARLRLAVDAMWQGLTERVLSLPLPYERTRLYQDGLPVCAPGPGGAAPVDEARIVRDVAAQGSRNHQLLLRLMERGATLMGTEDPPLLVRELRRVRALLGAEALPKEAQEALLREGDELLSARDAFIARRIDETLREGETGVAFLGLLHRVDELLPGGFSVQHIIHSLPFGADAFQRLKEQLKERTSHVAK